MMPFVLMTAGIVQAEPHTLLSGKVAYMRTATKEMRFYCRAFPVPPMPLPGDPANFPNTGGASVRMQDVNTPGSTVTINIPPGAGWTTPSWGYLYGAPAAPGTCRYLRVRASGVTAGVKGKCHTNGLLPTPFAGELAVEIRLGSGPPVTYKPYCCSFGGTTVRNDNAFFRRTNAPAPPACAVW
jgi:hypothetical protein